MHINRHTQKRQCLLKINKCLVLNGSITRLKLGWETKKYFLQIHLFLGRGNLKT